MVRVIQNGKSWHVVITMNSHLCTTRFVIACMTHCTKGPPSSLLRALPPWLWGFPGQMANFSAVPTATSWCLFGSCASCVMYHRWRNVRCHGISWDLSWSIRLSMSFTRSSFGWGAVVPIGSGTSKWLSSSWSTTANTCAQVYYKMSLSLLESLASV